MKFKLQNVGFTMIKNEKSVGRQQPFKTTRM